MYYILYSLPILRMPLLFQSSITNVGIMQKCEQKVHRTNIIIVLNSAIPNVCVSYFFLGELSEFFC